MRMKEWLLRVAEIAANFVIPGLGGVIFATGSRRNAFWQMILSVSGLILTMAGSGIFLSVFVDSSGLRLEEEYVAEALQTPSELYWMMIGLAGVIFGGVLVLGGFLWSLENAMKRWRSFKPQAEEPVECSGAQ